MLSIRTLARVRKEPRESPQDINDKAHAGSYVGAALACIAACALIFAAGAQNVAFAWQLGMASSPFKAGVLAVASAGASLLGPLAFASISHAFRKRRFGGAIVALMLGTGALTHSAVSSLGFVHGSRAAQVSESTVAADGYADRRALAKAARDELATLKGNRPDVVERRSELTALLASLAADSPNGVRPAARDPQAGAVAFYLRAAGWNVSEADVGVWLSAAMVLFLEAAAATSLIVAGALAPVRSGRPSAPAAPSPIPDSPDTREAAPRPRQRARTAVSDAVVAAVRENGGRVSGGARTLARVVGAKKSTVHDAIVALIASGELVRVGGELLLR